MSGCLSVLRSFLTVRLLALTSTRINADNGVVASAAINRHRCCANAPRPLARPFPLLPSESFDWLIRFSCRYVVCTVTLLYAVYVPRFGPNYDGILELHCRLIRRGRYEKFQGWALIVWGRNPACQWQQIQPISPRSDEYLHRSSEWHVAKSAHHDKKAQRYIETNLDGLQTNKKIVSTSRVHYFVIPKKCHFKSRCADTRLVIRLFPSSPNGLG